MEMDLLKGLNQKQQEVVTTTEGPVLVLAGAGSGKTKALTHRIAYLIYEKKINPSNILAITFTNKAAKEMSQRVENLLGKYNKNISMPTLGTFHSICARILREDGHFLGHGRNYVIFDEADSVSLIRKIIKKLELPEEKISPRGVKSYISSAKNESIEPGKYASLANGYFQEIVARVYPIYQKELRLNNGLDFDDLLTETVKLLEKFPEVLTKYQKRWPFLLIDEYQDTNRTQYLFSKLIARRSGNICVVGDDWQSIYAFRGANFQNILDFEKDWPKTKVIKLEQNYRSTKAILLAAQNVIETNENRSEKTLWTDNDAGHPVNIYEARNEEDESRFLCQESEKLKGQGYCYKEIAVFYRTNAQSRAVEEQLLRQKIPYKIVGGVRFYERKEIKDVLAWLRVASGANDFLSFERSLMAPPSGVGARTIEKLRNLSEKKGLKINELKNCDELLDNIGQRGAHLFEEYWKKIETISRQSEKSLKLGIKSAIELSGLREYFSDSTFIGEERLENLNELLSVAEEYEVLKGKLSLSDFLVEVALISDIDNYQDTDEGLTLMTLHTSKGLEFKVVFIIGTEENILPHSRSIFEPAELEEERRLFYVGITRAKEILYITYTRSRLFFGNIQSNLPSRFLAEIPDGISTLVNAPSHSDKTPKLTEENVPGIFTAGDKIEHENFGAGIVRTVSDDELTVDFKKHGEKIISVYYAPIKKV